MPGSVKNVKMSAETKGQRNTKEQNAKEINEEKEMARVWKEKGKKRKKRKRKKRSLLKCVGPS